MQKFIYYNKNILIVYKYKLKLQNELHIIVFTKWVSFPTRWYMSDF